MPLKPAGQDSLYSGGGINGMSVPLPSNAAYNILGRNASQDLHAGIKLEFDIKPVEQLALVA